MADQVPFVIHQDPVPLRVDADGVVRVGAGRLTLATVIEAAEEGLCAAKIAEGYGARLADIHAVLAYYYLHLDEVKPYLDQQAYESFRLRSGIEAQQTPFPTRAELQERLDRQHAESGK